MAFKKTPLATFELFSWTVFKANTGYSSLERENLHIQLQHHLNHLYEVIKMYIKDYLIPKVKRKE